MNKLLSGFILVSTGLVAGYYAQPFLQEQLQASGLIAMDESSGGAAKSDEEEVLYWVAPMDANYRRDKPGKSPMGMDLVPFYKADGGEDGVVKISPIVQNNLGVRTGSVKKGQLDREIDTVGYINFDEEKLYHLHTRVEGWVEKLLVKATGEVVKKGQKLFEIYSPTLVNAQEEYVTALKSQNRILIKASKDRLISLGISKGQIARLGKTRKIQQRVSYFAKEGGFIQDMKILEGMFVKPSMNVLTIGQIDTVWVIAEVFERQSSWVKEGQTVDMNVESYPEKSWKGIVDYIYPVLDKKTRTLRVRIRFNNPGQLLKPNMFSRLIIHSSFNKNSLFVKREAIIRSGTMERVVKSLGDGKFQSVAVKTGSESGHFIEILSGLKENDVIVTSAQFLIDSESSLTASFDRMEEPAEMSDSDEMSDDKTQVWIEGKIIDVMPGHKMLTIQHKAVAEWGWPDMLMDFPVKKSIAMDALKAQQDIKFLVEKYNDGSIELIEIEGMTNSNSMDKKANNDQAWIKGKILTIMADAQKLKLEHEPVKSWGWPAMKMDFPVIKSMDLTSLKEGTEFNFLVEKHGDGSIEIIEMNKEGL
ncbi:efflux RND transporter periplasmic adaptor subunit [sulfur-oxidizing endosymbiont of Gigantopelta aegis]|uniref:efflux RND transporter periplasmic adaptor subunit n=1 Tax=sulfur-oxidizing endosymbiont of Gigantopelta aegis TaxID=2794934 RepID=UPI0018DB07FE|nr:efflux RND transporter periplasmic adaptor subunit [sulfur-oxidizing endosymbiont of Gigantopelta aegis]